MLSIYSKLCLGVFIIALVVGKLEANAKADGNADASASASASASAEAGAGANPITLPFFDDKNKDDDSDAAHALERMFSTGGALMKALKFTGIRLGGSSINFIPTPDRIFRLSKQLLLGLPQELVAYAINEVCSNAVSVNGVQPMFMPDIEDMAFEFLTTSAGGTNITVPLTEPSGLWEHPSFCRDCETVMVITGWNSNANYTNDALEKLYAAYRRRNINFVFFDTAKFVDTLYIWSAFNTVKVGELIGQALAEFINYADVSQIHLVGHSLGAHMCGYAARKFKELTGKQIPRLVGLDPARPCFNEGERLGGLKKDDAAFVEIIHSNPGILGIRESIGTVDFYPNGRVAFQPGCVEIVCSHSRSYEYYAESVIPGNEKTFMSKQCNSFSAYREEKCVGDVAPMGFSTPNNVIGNFYLMTNMFSPYGRNPGVPNYA